MKYAALSANARLGEGPRPLQPSEGRWRPRPNTAPSVEVKQQTGVRRAPHMPMSIGSCLSRPYVDGTQLQGDDLREALAKHAVWDSTRCSSSCRVSRRTRPGQHPPLSGEGFRGGIRYCISPASLRRTCGFSGDTEPAGAGASTAFLIMHFLRFEV